MSTPLEKSSCKNFPNLFFIVSDIEWLPENCQYDMYIPGNMFGKNEWNWPYSFWTIELKPTQLWPPQKSTFCDRSVWLRHGKSTISQRWQSLGWKQWGLQYHTLPNQCKCRRERCIVYWEDTENTPVMWRTTFREKARNHYCSWYFP